MMLQQQICARNPHLSADQAAQYILKLRQSNSNGRLTGLSLQEIFQGVEKLMRQDGQGQETSESECSICMENMQPGAPSVRTLPCSHRFHNSCINVSNHLGLLT